MLPWVTAKVSFRLNLLFTKNNNKASVMSISNVSTLMVYWNAQISLVYNTICSLLFNIKDLPFLDGAKILNGPNDKFGSSKNVLSFQRSPNSRIHWSESIVTRHKPFISIQLFWRAIPRCFGKHDGLCVRANYVYSKFLFPLLCWICNRIWYRTGFRQQW